MWIVCSIFCKIESLKLNYVYAHLSCITIPIIKCPPKNTHILHANNTLIMNLQHESFLRTKGVLQPFGYLIRYNLPRNKCFSWSPTRPWKSANFAVKSKFLKQLNAFHWNILNFQCLFYLWKIDLGYTLIIYLCNKLMKGRHMEMLFVSTIILINRNSVPYLCYTQSTLIRLGSL